jgi:hypothetical protein
MRTSPAASDPGALPSAGTLKEGNRWVHGLRRNLTRGRAYRRRAVAASLAAAAVSAIAALA